MDYFQVPLVYYPLPWFAALAALAVLQVLDSMVSGQETRSMLRVLPWYFVVCSLAILNLVQYAYVTVALYLLFDTISAAVSFLSNNDRWL